MQNSNHVLFGGLIPRRRRTKRVEVEPSHAEMTDDVAESIPTESNRAADGIGCSRDTGIARKGGLVESRRELVASHFMPQVRELKNHRNTCFINVVVQQLATMDRSLLGVHDRGASCTEFCRSCCLHEVLEQYRSGSTIKLKRLTDNVFHIQEYCLYDIILVLYNYFFLFISLTGSGFGAFKVGEEDDCFQFWIAAIGSLDPNHFEVSAEYRTECSACKKQLFEKARSTAIQLEMGPHSELHESLE